MSRVQRRGSRELTITSFCYFIIYAVEIRRLKILLLHSNNMKIKIRFKYSRAAAQIKWRVKSYRQENCRLMLENYKKPSEIHAESRLHILKGFRW